MNRVTSRERIQAERDQNTILLPSDFHDDEDVCPTWGDGGDDSCYCTARNPCVGMTVEEPTGQRYVTEVTDAYVTWCRPMASMTRRIKRYVWDSYARRDE